MKRHVTLSIQDDAGTPIASVGLELGMYPAVGELGGVFAELTVEGETYQGWGESDTEAVCDILHTLACEGHL